MSDDYKLPCVNSYDIDGVIFLGKGRRGLKPAPDDIIITGRSFEEAKDTKEMLSHFGIENTVFFNPIPYDMKTRESSGQHKARVLNQLKGYGQQIDIHFEDDPIQAEEIRKACPWITVVEIVHELVEKENAKHQWR